MNLKKYILPDCVFAGVEASSKEELFRLQAAAIYNATPARYLQDVSLDELIGELIHREDKQSTGLGDGIAVPHARIPGFKHIGISLATLKNPLAYDAIDDQPVDISCMVIAAAETPGIIIKIWSLIAKLLNDPAVHSYFMQAESSQQIYDYLQNQVETLESDMTLTARDIMRKLPCRIGPDAPLPDVTYQMYKHREPAVAVTDDDDVMLGEITSDAVFQYGMPEFFTQLQSVSFVRHFNPLEKYFTDEAKNLAKDIMRQDYAAVPPDATLIEVLFQLSVKKHTKVYVQDKNGKLIGVIGRLSILDRAINF